MLTRIKVPYILRAFMKISVMKLSVSLFCSDIILETCYVRFASKRFIDFVPPDKRYRSMVIDETPSCVIYKTDEIMSGSGS